MAGRGPSLLQNATFRQRSPLLSHPWNESGGLEVPSSNLGAPISGSSCNSRPSRGSGLGAEGSSPARCAPKRSSSYSRSISRASGQWRENRPQEVKARSIVGRCCGHARRAGQSSSRPGGAGLVAGVSTARRAPPMSGEPRLRRRGGQRIRSGSVPTTRGGGRRRFPARGCAPNPRRSTPVGESPSGSLHPPLGELPSARQTARAPAK